MARSALEFPEVSPMIQEVAIRLSSHTCWQVMRWLIDGYNVMHAGGRLGPKLGREGFRRARRRFLDELSAALGPDVARQTTVVFDASVHPGDFALDADYRGLGILFALGDENADARIEQIIAEHSEPQDADRRFVRSPHPPGGRAPPDQVAHGRPVLGADRRSQGTTGREARPASRRRPSLGKIDDSSDRCRPSRPSGSRPSATSTTLPEIQAALAPNDALLTDAEIAEIEREVEREHVTADGISPSAAISHAAVAHRSPRSPPGNMAATVVKPMHSWPFRRDPRGRRASHSRIRILAR